MDEPRTVGTLRGSPIRFVYLSAATGGRLVSARSGRSSFDDTGDDGARIFDGPVLIWEDKRRAYGEDRFRAIGESAGDTLHVAFTWRGEAMRIISVRRANGQETELWRLRK